MEKNRTEYQPIDGIPAAIAVNLGNYPYVWDTTECRLLYAWTDGFLDMVNYWGDRASGRRKGFDMFQEYGFVFTRHWKTPTQNRWGFSLQNLERLSTWIFDRRRSITRV